MNDKLTRFIHEVNVDVEGTDPDTVLTKVTDWILAHPLVVAVVILTLILMKAVKNRTFRSGMIFVGGVLATILFFIPYGVFDS